MDVGEGRILCRPFSWCHLRHFPLCRSLDAIVYDWPRLLSYITFKWLMCMARTAGGEVSSVHIYASLH